MKTKTFVGYVPAKETLTGTISQALINNGTGQRIKARFGMEKSKQKVLEVSFGIRKIVKRTITITVKDEEV